MCMAFKFVRVTTAAAVALLAAGAQRRNSEAPA